MKIFQIQYFEYQEFLCSFFPEKRTKNLVAQKTHFGIIALTFRSGLLSRLFGFQIQFLICDLEI